MTTVSQRALTFEDEQVVSSVPAGFSRRLVLATIRAPYQGDLSGPYVCGEFATRGRVPIHDRMEWKITITVTGPNFNAKEFRGVMRSTVEIDDYEDPLAVAITWPTPLVSVPFERPEGWVRRSRAGAGGRVSKLVACLDRRTPPSRP